MKDIQLRNCKNCNNLFYYNAATKREKNRMFCCSTCAKISNGKNNKGKKRTDDFKSNLKNKFTGEGNPFFGKNHSDEFKKKLSNDRKGKNTGSDNINWKGGFREGKEYLRVTDGTHYHRLIMENKLGRKLFSWEHVHHIDENKRNNDPDNLMIVTNSEHRKMHASTQKRNNEGKFTK